MRCCRGAHLHTRGGSVSLAKCRCLAMAATKSSSPRRFDAMMSPESGLTAGSRRSIPQAPSSLPAPNARIGLQWRYWSLMNSSVRPSARSALMASSPSGAPTRQSTAGAASRLTSTSMASPAAGCTAPSVVDTKRGTALHSSADRRGPRATAAHPVRHEDRHRRVRMLPSPGRANNDSAGDTETVTSRVSTSASAPASRGCRAPPRRFRRVPPRHSSARHHPLPHRGCCTRESSKRTR